MLEKMKSLVKKNDLCVLATVSEGKPHCSLMSYLFDDRALEIYMVSQKDTKKYSNLKNNPMVSILIDTRIEEKGKDRKGIKALAVKGEFQTIIDQVKKDSIRRKFMKQQPHLADLLKDTEADIFSIRIRSFQLLDGVKDVYFETVS